MEAPLKSSLSAEQCPVDHGAKADKCPVDHGKSSVDEAQKKCPVDHSSGKVFLEQAGAPTEQAELDPRNNMPKVAEQKMWPGQRVALSTNRVESVIPKSDFTPEHQKHAKESSSWMYPSEQQFYNAMKRKGWQPREEDMKIVLAIHNHVNDRAWSEVMKWEELHACDCDMPKLKRFMGKPKELSPKATVRSWLGYAKPFDRHDWIVDRCGKDVRYIIDFYQGAPANPESGQVVSMFLDARPALDSWEAFVDRAKMQFKEIFSIAR